MTNLLKIVVLFLLCLLPMQAKAQVYPINGSETFSVQGNPFGPFFKISTSQIAGLATGSGTQYQLAYYPVTGSSVSGTSGITTDASGDIATLGGQIANGVFGGSYSDGLVQDYAAPTGRFSVGASDGFAWYTGGVGTTSIMTLSSAGALSVTSNFAALNNAAKITMGASSDAILTRPAAANWQLGAADAAAPVAQTLSVQNVVTGTSNTAGTNWTLGGSQGTGTGVGGDIVFSTSPAGTTGTAQNARVADLTVAPTCVGAPDSICVSYTSGIGTISTGASDVLNFAENGATTLSLSTSSHIRYVSPAPTVSACGTNTLDTGASDAAGMVNITAGTPASCTITFAAAYATNVHCRVTSESVNAAFAYSYSLSAITVTGTALAGKIDYNCDGY